MNTVATEVVKFALATQPNATNAEIATLAGVSEQEVVTYRNKTTAKGTETLKQYAARYLLEMTEEDKRAFIKKLPEEMVWKMAEGSPATTGSLDLINTEPIRIDITHQLLKVYGPTSQTSITALPPNSETNRLPERSGE